MAVRESDMNANFTRFMDSQDIPIGAVEGKPAA